MKAQGMGVFDTVGSLMPGRSKFDLSYDKKLTCDMGQLIPILCEEMVPGDSFEVGNELVIRFQPLVAPVLHEINAYVHYFFVPYRILWEDWEDFITGGDNGESTAVLPRWFTPNTAEGTLWDYMGFPTGVDPADAYPMNFPRSAYNRIYNEYYRDENLQDPVDETNQLILNRAWEKDYFTSELPWQQKGTAPALPIHGHAPAVFDFGGGSSSYGLIGPSPAEGSEGPHELASTKASGTTTAQVLGNSADAWTNEKIRLILTSSLGAYLSTHNLVDLNLASTFNVADIRLAFQIQKWMERNARAGSRYTEFLKAHYGVSPRDDRLQRPEYIGGSKSPIMISEVLQTGSTDSTSPQGNMAGHGLVADSNFCGKYHAQEFGLIMGIMSIMPRSGYQQGINRQWLRRNRFDFYSPEFANLSEQAVEYAEIMATASAGQNRAVFGYQGRFDEMRIKNSMVCGQMRTTFSYWHLSRIFSALPSLNSGFITCVPRKDIFAAPSEPGLIVNIGNKIMASRPIPIRSEPGLIDHN